MKYFTLFIIIAFISCKQTDKGNKKIPSQNESVVILQAPADCDYDSRKAQCQKLFTIYNTTVNLNKSKLTKFFIDSLLPCWYGTPWDFNGCTASPNNGKIACGYFITTTLQDAGISINRIKMAQCPSSELIRSVCSDIKTFSNISMENFVAEIKKSGYGLYIAGLDFHTGFIYNDGKEVYFIHSSYYGSKCVVKEKALECVVLRNSKLKMVGKVNLKK